MTGALAGPVVGADAGGNGGVPAPEAADVPVLDMLRARRDALAAGRDALRRRLAAQRVAVAEALTAAAAVRDAAELVQAESQVQLRVARGRPLR